MPNRVIKDSICTSDTVDQLTWFEEVFFYRLMVNVDDYGRFDARPAILKARLFPLKSGITEKQIEQSLSRLVTVGLVSTYMVEAKPILQLPTWEKHQTIRNSKSKYPGPEEAELQSIEINCIQLHSNAPVIQSNPNPNPNPNPDTNGADKPPKTRTKFIPPTIDEVKAYCLERANGVDAEHWYAYYTANGWMVGRNAMKNWQASVRTWEKNGYGGSNGTNRAGSDNDRAGAGPYAGDGSVDDYSKLPAIRC